MLSKWEFLIVAITNPNPDKPEKSKRTAKAAKCAKLKRFSHLHLQPNANVAFSLAPPARAGVARLRFENP